MPEMSTERQLSLGLPPPADSDTPLIPARMVNEWVYCPRLAYLEWVEGKRPHVAAGAYEPERVQVCVQAMILEDNGYRVSMRRLIDVQARLLARHLQGEIPTYPHYLPR